MLSFHRVNQYAGVYFIIKERLVGAWKGDPLPGQVYNTYLLFYNLIYVGIIPAADGYKLDDKFLEQQLLLRICAPHLNVNFFCFNKECVNLYTSLYTYL